MPVELDFQGFDWISQFVAQDIHGTARGLRELADFVDGKAFLLGQQMGAAHEAENAEINVLRKAILTIVAALSKHLPPDGISARDCISEILGATDNATINPYILAAQGTSAGTGETERLAAKPAGPVA